MQKYFFLFCFLVLLFVGKINAQSYTTQQETLPCLNKKFTIVAHIFKDSLGSYGITEQIIKDALVGANAYFAPICVSFEICEFRYNDNFQHDIIENDNELAQMTTKFTADYRINMYFVNSISGDACGLAYGGISGVKGSGVFIEKPNCATPKVYAHELGHFFSLLHTFEGNGVELVNGDNCTTVGDEICDTPADPFVPGSEQEQFQVNCIFISPLQDANGEFYTPDLGNIMSYYECPACGFTWQQLNRMAQAYLNAPEKYW